MTRGTQFLNNSKCPCCKKHNKVSRPYGHMTENKNLFLKGYCPSCKKKQNHCLTLNNSLVWREKELKNSLKIVYNKVLKPTGREAIKNISKDPMKTLQIRYSIKISNWQAKIHICYYECWYPSR